MPIYLVQIITIPMMKELSSLLAQFNENGIESNHLTLITNRLKDLEKTAIGSAITEFSLPDINGTM